MLASPESWHPHLGGNPGSATAGGCTQKHCESFSLLTNRNVLFQKHLFCMTIYGLMWSSAMKFNIRCQGDTPSIKKLVKVQAKVKLVKLI